MKRELSVLTSLLIARTSSQTLSDLMDPSGNHDIGTRTTMRWKGNEARELFIQIATNISLYTRNCIFSYFVDHRRTNVCSWSAVKSWLGRIRVATHRQTWELSFRSSESLRGILQPRKAHASTTVSLDKRAVYQRLLWTQA